MEDALIKRIKNALANRTGKDLALEITKAVDYYVSQVATLTARSASAGFLDSIRAGIVTEILEAIINYLQQETKCPT